MSLDNVSRSVTIVEIFWLSKVRGNRKVEIIGCPIISEGWSCGGCKELEQTIPFFRIADKGDFSFAG
jgi:hypothetical protein